MSYAQALLSSLFVQKPFKLSGLPGLWVLSTDTAVGSTCIVFSSCTVPTVYMASGLSYWYSGSSRDWTAVNWALCTGPEPPLPNFPWGTDVPTFTELVQYLHDNRFSGPCEGSGGGGSMTTLYSGNGELAGNRIVDFKDKLLVFYPSLNGSAFAISRDGGTFPPTSLNQLAFRFDPDDFLGTGKPGMVFGYQNIPGGSGGDSAAIQISQVTGQKGVMTTCIDEANGKFMTQMINDDHIQWQATGAGGSTQFTIEGGNIYADGIPLTATPDVLFYDTGSKGLSYGPIPTPVINNALFVVRTDIFGMTVPNLSANVQIPTSGTVFHVDVARGDYNNAGLELDLTLGTYSPSQTFVAEVTASFWYTTTTTSAFGVIDFYNVTDNQVIGTYHFNINTAGGESNTFVLRTRLNAAKIYVWRITNGVGAGTVKLQDGIFSINKV